MYERAFEQAAVVDEATYDGFVFSPDIDGGNDGYFRDVEELVDCCENEGIDVPDAVFCCDGRSFQIDIDHVIETAFDKIGLDDSDPEALLKLLDELRYCVAKFNNANAGVKSWREDRTRKILTRKGIS